MKQRKALDVSVIEVYDSNLVISLGMVLAD